MKPEKERQRDPSPAGKMKKKMNPVPDPSPAPNTVHDPSPAPNTVHDPSPAPSKMKKKMNPVPDPSPAPKKHKPDPSSSAPTKAEAEREKQTLSAAAAKKRAYHPWTSSRPPRFEWKGFQNDPYLKKVPSFLRLGVRKCYKQHYGRSLPRDPNAKEEPPSSSPSASSTAFPSSSDSPSSSFVKPSLPSSPGRTIFPIPPPPPPPSSSSSSSSRKPPSPSPSSSTSETSPMAQQWKPWMESGRPEPPWLTPLMHPECRVFDVEPDKPFILNLMRDNTRKRMHLYMARLLAVEPVGGVKISQTTSTKLMVTIGNKSILLCKLSDHVQSYRLDLEFEEQELVFFSVIGSQAISVYGYYIKGLLPGVGEEPLVLKTLFVEGLPWDCTHEEALNIFSPFKGFKEVRLVVRRPILAGKNPYVLCFAEFSSYDEAVFAMNSLQGYNVGPGAKMKLAFAHGRLRRKH